MRNHALLAAALLGMVALVAATAAPAAGTEVVALDDEHGLTEQEAITAYEHDGVASTEVQLPQTTLTIADDTRHLDRSRRWFDSSTYLRAQYHEDIQRSIRIYVPEDYWAAHEDQSMTSLDGQTEAEMEPVEINGTTYSAVTIHLDGETDAVFRVNDVQSGLWGLRDTGFDVLNRSVPGWTLPRLNDADDNPWEYVDSRDFADGSYDTNASSVIVEYDTAPGPENGSDWVEAPSCDSEKPVCTLERSGEIVIIPQNSTDPPAVRYKTDPSIRDRATTGVRGVRDTVDGLVSSARDLVGGEEET